jgi:hypothetical protein
MSRNAYLRLDALEEELRMIREPARSIDLSRLTDDQRLTLALFQRRWQKVGRAGFAEIELDVVRGIVRQADTRRHFGETR